VSAAAFRLVAAGDSVVIVELEDRIDERINAQAIRIAERVEAARMAGVRDVVPTYRSVAVYFDPLRTDYTALSDLLEQEGVAATKAAEGTNTVQGRRPPVRIPVKYGGDEGPDLAGVAAFARLSEAEVVARHTGRVYRVFMMGFLPGFPYLGTVDPSIAAPRHATPRLKVASGSVGIAGSQTGIYPSETPGGWQVIGRTRVKLFDLSRAGAFLLSPGDAVEFYAE
jgi:KipI family sensor histidine kinase inhibitor